MTKESILKELQSCKSCNKDHLNHFSDSDIEKISLALDRYRESVREEERERIVSRIDFAVEESMGEEIWALRFLKALKLDLQTNNNTTIKCKHGKEFPNNLPKDAEITSMKCNCNNNTTKVKDD